MVSLSSASDTREYEKADVTSSHFDLTKYSGYHYTEFSTYCYSNGDLLDAGIANANIGTAINSRQLLPYVFNDFGAEDIKGAESAKSVVIPYSEQRHKMLLADFLCDIRSYRYLICHHRIIWTPVIKL